MDYLQYFYQPKMLYTKVGTVLNLIINGLPSIFRWTWRFRKRASIVLNLIINGLPSISCKYCDLSGFSTVLNLIINGLPSILKHIVQEDGTIKEF